MIVEGQIAYNFYHLKILAGKLRESWLLVKKIYFTKKNLSTEFNAFLENKDQECLNYLKKYFDGGSKSAINLIRDKLAFHYSPEHLVLHLPKIQDELSLYISEGNDLNTLYYFAEAIVNRTVLSAIETEEDENPIEAMNKEIITVASNFNKLNLLFLKFMTAKHKDKIFKTACEEMQCDELVSFEDVKIPFFTQTDFITKKPAR